MSVAIFLLSILALTVSVCHTYQLEEHDTHDHILLISSNHILDFDLQQLNVSAINYSKYRTVINWNGIYNMVDFGYPVVYRNISLLQADIYSNLTRDQKALSIVHTIDPYHLAFRGLGNESRLFTMSDQIMAYNASDYYRTNPLENIILHFKKLEELFESSMSYLIKIYNYIVPHFVGTLLELLTEPNRLERSDEIMWHNVKNSSGIDVTYLVAVSTWSTNKNCYDHDKYDSFVDERVESLQKQENYRVTSQWNVIREENTPGNRTVRVMLWEVNMFRCSNIWAMG